MSSLNVDVARIFGHTNEQEIVNYILKRDEDFEDLIGELDDEHAEYLMSIMKPLTDREKIGKKQAKYAVELSRLLIAYRTNDYNVEQDFSNFDSIKGAYYALKNIIESDTLSKDYDHSPDSLDYRVTFEAGGKTYMAIFEPENGVLQDVALEKVKSCFSLGGVCRDYVDAYLNSNNADIFFVPVIDIEKGSIVGRFALGLGCKCEHDSKIRDAARTDVFNAIVRLGKLYVDYGDSSAISETDIDSIVEKYALRLGTNFVSHGSFVIEVPKGCKHVYDDYFQSEYDNDSTSLGIESVNGRRFEKLFIESRPFNAVKSRDVNEFSKLVANGIDPNELDYEGAPLVFRVIHMGESEMFRTLLAQENFRTGLKLPESRNNIVHAMAMNSREGGDMLAHFYTSGRFDRDLLYEKNGEGKTPAEIAIEVEDPNPEFLKVALKIDPNCMDVYSLLDRASSELNRMERMERNIFARTFRRIVDEDPEERNEIMEGMREVVNILSAKVGEIEARKRVDRPTFEPTKELIKIH